MVRITVQTNAKHIENTDSKPEVLPLDEENEVYGYGVYNVRRNCFIDLPESDLGIWTSEPHLTQEKNEDVLKEIAELHDLDSVSHLRIVEVRLHNELDKKASQQVKPQ